MSSKIKVDDYGDILALKVDGEKVYYSEEGGSYQGNYVAVIKSEKEVGIEYFTQFYIFVGYYGSCSSCDWLESEKDWDTGEVDAKAALDYTAQSVPLYILPKKPTLKWVNELAAKANG